ncbi:MAG: HAMP domain-containing histidine kinase [Thermodesulfovibrionales bacterium]|nr:HAMP domain-containing histidine kinase [Thermodesulfovibrionales bacterium]
MKNFTDDELIAEIKKRFDDNKKALHDLRMLSRKLEDMNRKLMESESMKSNFISNIKNELNNPLTNALLLSKTLTDGDISSDQIKEISSSIFSELFNLDFQLTNIFAAAEIEAGTSPMSISNVDIDELIRDVIDNFSHLIKQKDLKYDYSFINKNEDSPYFKIDSSKLQLIIKNLVANAIEFSDHGGSFDIKAWKHTSYLNLIISDNGPGIDEDLQEAIFERFRQLDMGANKRHKGHGLGLSICKTLIDMMEGTITVTSKVGMGTIFTLFIPESKIDIETGIFSESGNEFFFDEEEKF